MDYEYFNARLNNEFRIVFAPGHEHAAKLIEVTKLPEVPGQKREPFSLLFQTDLRDHYFNQGVFTVKDQQDELTLFLVPVGQDPQSGAVNYQAIFN